MSRVAVIPARGGSKRLPRKNVLPFRGKPLIVWTIEAAQQSGIFDRVLVSTDSQEIADIVKAETGLETPFLRDDAADDVSPVSLATLRALEQLEEELGEKHELVFQLMANCPLRNAADIRAVDEALQQVGTTAVISCFEYGWMNPWWALRIDAQGHADWLHPGAIKQRSQDLGKLYCPSGAIWGARVDALRESKEFKREDATYLPLTWQSCVDIDDEHDFQFALAVAETLSQA